MRACVRRPRATLAVWGTAVAVLTALGLGVTSRLGQPDLVAPGTPSAHARDVAEARFGRTTTVPVLLTGDGARAAGGVLAATARGRGWGVRLLPRRGAVLAVVAVPAASGRRPEADTRAMQAVHAAAATATAGRARAQIGGSAAVYDQLRRSSEDAAKMGELVAAPILVVVLLLVLGAPLAALLPGMLGGVSVLAGMGVLRLVAGLTDMTVFAATLTSMMGLALGVDYALLLIARYREERAAGREAVQAAEVAVAGAGRTLTFAAGVLAVAMGTAIVLSHGNLLVSPAVGVLAAAVVALVSALTALPALLVLADARLERGRVRRDGGARGGVARIPRLALRRPVLASLVVLVPLVALAVPGTTLKTGPGDVRQLPADTDARRAVEAIAATAGPGWTAPIDLVLASDQPLSQAGWDALAALRARAAADPGTALVISPAQRSPDGRAARLTVVPRDAPNTAGTEGLSARLTAAAAAAGRPGGAELLVGGVGAELAQFHRDTADQLPLLVGTLAAVTFLVLLLVLRAPLLALVSVALNLLTVAVAFGVIVLLFQGDDPLLGGAGYLEVIAMVSMFTVMFGLSIDYQVFLLDRMREGLAETGDPVRAITWGLDRTARVVTGAAAIMVGVFLAFATTDVATIRQFGIGLAVAIAVDAAVVRLVLLPVAMRAGGRWTWWPRFPVGRLISSAAWPPPSRRPRPAAPSSSTSTRTTGRASASSSPPRSSPTSPSGRRTRSSRASSS